jgi:uncharacterized membrane protein
MNTLEPLLVDRKEAARRFSVCERTIANMTKRGELAVVRLGAAVRYRYADLVALVSTPSEESQRQAAERAAAKAAVVSAKTTATKAAKAERRAKKSATPAICL